MTAGQINNGSQPAKPVVTVFGGTGFLGRRIVRRLLANDYTVRAVSRHSRQGTSCFSPDANSPELVEADILDTYSSSAAIAGSDVVVNAVSLYVEQGNRTFERVHVQGAASLASIARNGPVRQFIQISGIGSDARSRSSYIRARGYGEIAVANAFPGARIIRPAIMAGQDDAFLTKIIGLVQRLPVYPLFGDGNTQLQPVYVGDVAEAVGRLIDGNENTGALAFEFGGPRIYTYKQLLEEVIRQRGTRTKLIRMPFAAWDVLARASEFLPSPPITRNQVDLMKRNNVATGDLPGLHHLDIKPRNIGEVIRSIESLAKPDA